MNRAWYLVSGNKSISKFANIYVKLKTRLAVKAYYMSGAGRKRWNRLSHDNFSCSFSGRSGLCLTPPLLSPPPSVKEKLCEGYEDEIATTSLKCSLQCPLGKCRMQLPCRATTCQHLQVGTTAYTTPVATAGT